MQLGYGPVKNLCTARAQRAHGTQYTPNGLHVGLLRLNQKFQEPTNHRYLCPKVLHGARWRVNKLCIEACYSKFMYIQAGVCPGLQRRKKHKENTTRQLVASRELAGEGKVVF